MTNEIELGRRKVLAGFVGAAALLMAKVDVNGPTASPVFDWSLLFSRFVGGEGGVKGCSAPPPP